MRLAVSRILQPRRKNRGDDHVAGSFAISASATSFTMVSYRAFTPAMTLSIDFFASPKSITVFGSS